MTSLTVGIKSQVLVIGIICSGQVSLVAVAALRGGADEFVAGAGLVAGIAIRNRVNATERKSTLSVKVQGVGLRPPVAGGVTIGTINTQLTLVVVIVTIGTGSAHMTENQTLVAQPA
jgi:hypothetical protein